MEPLIYKEQLPQRTSQLIASTLKNENIAAFKAAVSDLNEDGTEEYVVTETDCTSNTKFCRSFILSNAEANSVVLGRVDAKNLVLSNTYTDGVRDLLVYNNPKNDYDYTELQWNARESSYVLKGAHAR